MKSQKISIIVPVYQSIHFLKRCVDSLLDQSISDFEVILVDDGSSDGSGELCDLLAEEDKRISVIHIENSGVSTARNIGVNASTGGFIGFVDSDDWIEPDLFKLQRENLIKYESDFVACGYYYHDEYNRIKKFPKKYIRSSLQGDDAIIALLQPDYFRGFLWNKLFRSEIFKSPSKTLKFDPNIHVCEDLFMIFSILANGSTMYFYETPLYHYYWQITSLTKNSSQKRYTELIAYSKMLDFNLSSKRVKHLLESRFAEISLNLMYNAKSKKNAKMIAQLENYIQKNRWKYFTCVDITIYEKLRFLIKQIFPIWSVRVLGFLLNARYRREMR